MAERHVQRVVSDGRQEEPGENNRLATDPVRKPAEKMSDGVAISSAAPVM